jgi:hypothetical protein
MSMTHDRQACRLERLQFAPAGRTLALSHGGNAVRLWDVDSLWDVGEDG